MQIAKGAVDVDACLDLHPEVAYELLLLQQVALLRHVVAMHDSGVVNTGKQSMGFAV